MVLTLAMAFVIYNQGSYMIFLDKYRKHEINKTSGRINATRLIIWSALFFVIFDNYAFFKNIVEVYPASVKNIGFLISLAVVLTGVIVLLLALVSSKYTLKPVLIVLLLVSSAAGYFMNNFNIVIDDAMIRGIFATNTKEAFELISLKLFLYVLVFGLLPSAAVYYANVQYGSWKRELSSRLKLIAVCLAVIFFSMLLFSKFYTSFFREQKPLRYRSNPTYYIYSLGKYVKSQFKTERIEIKTIGEDAKIALGDQGRELVILVIGEAARADRFSLNGYPRETNPLLKQEDVVSFQNVSSCATSTEISLPCMFSIYNRDSYSDTKGKSTENLLDVLNRVGVHILWRDNNSDSKGVALRVPYEDYKNPDMNPVCDEECRDEGMLVGLQAYIDNHPKGDILIVLHQMGNHGPAYYKRYPKSFEKFKPVCTTKQLDECTNEAINNAYDNAIVYTDYFLWQSIQLLKKNSAKFETAMIYFSDHGESLGENGLYLHGMPYIMAPDAQKRIACIFWLGERFAKQKNSLKGRINREYLHDNLFHTILGLMEVDTSIYDKNKDMVNSGIP